MEEQDKEKEQIVVARYGKIRERKQEIRNRRKEEARLAWLGTAMPELEERLLAPHEPQDGTTVHNSTRSSDTSTGEQQAYPAESNHICSRCEKNFTSSAVLKWHYGICEPSVFHLIETTLEGQPNSSDLATQRLRDVAPLIMEFTWPTISTPPPSEINIRYATILDTMTWTDTPGCRGCITKDNSQHCTSCTIIWKEYQDAWLQESRSKLRHVPVLHDAYRGQSTGQSLTHCETAECHRPLNLMLGGDRGKTWTRPGGLLGGAAANKKVNPAVLRFLARYQMQLQIAADPLHHLWPVQIPSHDDPPHHIHPIPIPGTYDVRNRSELQIWEDFIAFKERTSAYRKKRAALGLSYRPICGSAVHTFGFRHQFGFIKPAAADSIVSRLIQKFNLDLQTEPDMDESHTGPLNPMCDTVLVARTKYIAKAIPLSVIPDKFTKKLGNLAELTTLREGPIMLKQKRTALQAKAIREELLKSKSQLIMLNTLNIDGLNSKMGNRKIATVQELRQNYRGRAGPGKTNEANKVTAAAAEGDPSFVLHQHYGLDTGGKKGTAGKQTSKDQPNEPTPSQRKRLRKKAAKELKARKDLSQPKEHLLNMEPLFHCETNKEKAQNMQEAPRSTVLQSEEEGQGAQRRSWQMQVTSDLGETVPQYHWKSWKATNQATASPIERQEEVRTHLSGPGAELSSPASGSTEEAKGHLEREWKALDQVLTESKQRRLRRLRRATWNDYAPHTQPETSEETNITLDTATPNPEATRKEAYAQTNESGANGTEQHPIRGREQGSPISPLLWLAQNAPPFQPEEQLSPNQRDIEGWQRVQDMLDGRPPLRRSLPIQSYVHHGPVLVMEQRLTGCTFQTGNNDMMTFLSNGGYLEH
jgi:hypothetical protein